MDIANEILQSNGHIRITWYTNEAGEDYIKKNGSTMLLSHSIYMRFDEKGSISLANANRLSFISDYFSWSKQLSELRSFQESDVVISDNVAAPIEYRPDTLLVGSFLWSDVLINSINTRQVIDHEVALLTKVRPNMMHIQNFGMPAVHELTNPIGIPWVTQKLKIDACSRPNILITVGKSGENKEQFEKVALKLLGYIPDRVFVDSSLYESLSFLDVRKFGFTEGDFQSLALIICRPGIGIITDAVKYQIPILTFYDLENNELTFNAKQIVSQEIGVSMGLDSIDELDEKVSNLIEEGSHRKKILEGLASQFDGGALAAAEIILERIR